MRPSRLSARLALAVSLSLAAGCLFAASNAVAATEVASRVKLDQLPRLFGPGVAYVEQEGTKGAVVLRAAAPGAPVRNLASGFIRDIKCDNEECDSEGFLFDAARTPGRVAFSKVTTPDLSGGPRTFTLFTGGLSGPFPALFTCNKSSDVRIYEYHVDGDTLAYEADSCVDGLPGTRVTVRDFAAGGFGTKSFPLPADTSFALAGKVLAFFTSDSSDKVTVKVIDWTTGATLYTAPIGDRAFAFDTQADGKVVVGIPTDAGDEKGPPLPGQTRSTTCNVRIAWLSPAAPTLHKIAPCSEGDAQIEDDRIYFVRTDNKTEQLTQSDLAGNVIPVASIKGDGGFPSFANLVGAERFDVDGSRIAYPVSRCLGDSIYVQDLPAPAAKTETVSCPTSFTSTKIKVSKTGTIKLPLSCPKGCTGSLTLYKLLTDGSRGVDYVAGSIPSVTVSSGSKKLTVKLSKQALKAIKKSGKLAVSAQLFGPPFGTERKITLVK